jgi:hypothetical protein
LADTVDLVGPSGNIFDFVATAAGLPSDTVSVGWSLAAGSQYYLLQTTASNGVFATFGLAAPSNAQIALTDTGDFSYASLASANFVFGGGGGGGTAYWADFNNIVTSPDTVPEPASFTLVLPFALAVFLRARRKGCDSRG